MLALAHGRELCPCVALCSSGCAGMMPCVIVNNERVQNILHYCTTDTLLYAFRDVCPVFRRLLLWHVVLCTQRCPRLCAANRCATFVSCRFPLRCFRNRSRGDIGPLIREKHTHTTMASRPKKDDSITARCLAASAAKKDLELSFACGPRSLSSADRDACHSITILSCGRNWCFVPSLLFLLSAPTAAYIVAEEYIRRNNGQGARWKLVLVYRKFG